MKTSMLLATLLAAIGLAACERPTVVNNPPSTTVAVPTPVPGPPGPQGAPGKPGEPAPSSQSTPSGSSTTNVTITPPASSGSEPK